MAVQSGIVSAKTVRRTVTVCAAMFGWSGSSASSSSCSSTTTRQAEVGVPGVRSSRGSGRRSSPLHVTRIVNSVSVPTTGSRR